VVDRLLLVSLIAAVAGSSWLVPAGAQTFTQQPTLESADGGPTVAEGTIAAGPNHIMQVLHRYDQFVRVFPRTNMANPTVFNPDQIFGRGTVGDPVCHYDADGDRFIIVAQGPNGPPDPPGTSTVNIAVLKAGGNPTVASDYYANHFTVSDNDYPTVGVSGDKIIVVSGAGTRYGYLFDKPSLYSNHPSGIISPARILVWSVDYRPARGSAPDGRLFLAGIGSSRELVSLVIGPGSAATAPVGSPHLVASGSSDPYPNFEQPSTYPSDCAPRNFELHTRPGDLSVRNGRVTAAYNVEKDYADGSPSAWAIRCIRFEPDPQPVILDDFTIGTPGTQYEHPSACEDAQGTLVVGYLRSSATEPGSCYLLARKGETRSPEWLVKAGLSPLRRCRGTNCGASPWGDYTSTVVDEFTSTATVTNVLTVGQWVRNLNAVGSAIGFGRITYGTATISGTVQAYHGSFQPRAGVPIHLVQSGSVVSTTATNASGAYSFPALPAGTYIVRMNFDAGIALDAFAGTGGVSETALNSREIQVVITGTQTSSGNQFTIQSKNAPTLTYVSKTSVMPSDPEYLTGFDLAVWAGGTNLYPYSILRFDGRDVPTTYDVGSGLLHGTITANDVARMGNHTITVWNPGVNGVGTSAPATFTTVPLPPYVMSSTLPLPGSPALKITGCPMGDAGQFQASLVLRTSASCFVDAATTSAEMGLFAPADRSIRIWDAEWAPIPGVPQFIRYYVHPTRTYDAATQQITFTYAFNEFSGCAAVVGQVYVTKTSGAPSSTESFPFSLDLRSTDLVPNPPDLVVNLQDQAALNALVGTTDPCGDLTRDGSVDAGDLAFFTAHQGHYYNGGGGGGGGCPFVETWANGEWTRENSLLGRSVTGAAQWDAYRLKTVPEPSQAGTIRVRLHEFERERTRLESASLVCVDRDASHVSFAREGAVFLARAQSVTKVETSDGRDLSAALLGSNATGYQGQAGEVLLVTSSVPSKGSFKKHLVEILGGGKELDPPAPLRRDGQSATPPTQPQSGAAYDRQVLDHTGMVIEHRNAGGDWVEVARVYPREHPDGIAIPAAPELRIRFVGAHYLGGLRLLEADPDEAARVPITLSTMRHSRTGEFTTWQEPVHLSPGESLELEYRLPDLAPGKVRDYWLVAKGVYTTLGPEDIESAELPRQLALGNAMPNPTRDGLTIPFALPTRSKVELGIYDLAGRFVTRVIRGERDAGYHNVTWNLTDQRGRRVANGVYFYKIQVGKWHSERKVTVLP